MLLPWHQVILEQQGKIAGSTMFAGQSGNQNKSKRGDRKGKGRKTNADITSFNCGKKGHKKADCWGPGGGKEGQGLNQKSGKRGRMRMEESANIAERDN